MISSKHTPLAAASMSSAGAVPGSATPAVGAAEAGGAAEEASPQERLAQRLEAAALEAALAGTSLDEFMQRAWSAYVDARPGLREHLADAQLVQQIQELRAAGKVGSA